MIIERQNKMGRQLERKVVRPCEIFLDSVLLLYDTNEPKDQSKPNDHNDT